MGERAHDREDLTEALELIRAACPNAVAVKLDTSDQGRAGFVLCDVVLSGGGSLFDADRELFDRLDNDTWHLVSSLGWNGVVGENRNGYATVQIDDKLAELKSGTGQRS